MWYSRNTSVAVIYKMKQYYICIVFAVICIFGHITDANPPGKAPNYISHKNYNLLPPKSICGNNENELEDKVFGGSPASLGEFPWIVRLRYKHVPDPVIKCAGILINERYVLTAAHCVVGQEEILQVRLGEHDERTNPDVLMIDETNKIVADPILDVDVEEVITHEQYNGSIKHNDIAIIRMKQNIIYTKYIAPVCLPLNGEMAQIGHKLVIAGWGLTENNVTSPEKLKAYIPVVSQQQCSILYNTAKRRIVSTQLCAGGKQGVDTCAGDSGGPLVNTFDPTAEKYYLEGIVSFGTKYCGTKRVPGVYTRVSEFIDWILNNMKAF